MPKQPQFPMSFHGSQEERDRVIRAATISSEKWCCNKEKHAAQEIMMIWNEVQQMRSDELRKRQLAGPLTADERAELGELIANLEREEASYPGPVVARMELEQAALRKRLRKLEADNEEVARLLLQQKQLSLEARRWLADSQRRHQHIQATYKEITGEVLTAK